MKRTIPFLAAIVVCAASLAYAEYSVSGRGEWPKTWPKELEPLRNQSSTFDGPLPANLHYAIPFTKREEFEAAWPHLLKVKSKGAPVILLRGRNFFLGDRGKAGVVIHAPPAGQADKPVKSGALINATDARSLSSGSTYIELVVDGDIVDLNRIPLPPDTLIVDERFKDAGNK